MTARTVGDDRDAARRYAAASEIDPSHEAPAGWDEDRDCWANERNQRGHR